MLTKMWLFPRYYILFLYRLVLFYVSFIVRGWAKHVSMAPEVSAAIEGFVFRLGFHVFMSPCVDMQAFVSFAYEFPEWSMSCSHVISIRSCPLLTCPIKGPASCHVPIHVRKPLRDGWDDPRRTCFIVSHPNVVVPQYGCHSHYPDQDSVKPTLPIFSGEAFLLGTRTDPTRHLYSCMEVARLCWSAKSFLGVSIFIVLSFGRRYVLR